MKKEMLINVLQPEECRIAILEDGILEELYVERTSHESYVGNIYKGRIVNIEPSIQAAFVDFGVGRNGFLHVSDVEPAYYRHLEGHRDLRGNGRRGGRNGDRRRGGPRRQEAYFEEDLGPEPLEQEAAAREEVIPADAITPSEEIPVVNAESLEERYPEPVVPEALAEAESESGTFEERVEPEGEQLRAAENEGPEAAPGAGPEAEPERGRRRGRGRHRGRRGRGEGRGPRGEGRGRHEGAAEAPAGHGTPQQASPPSSEPEGKEPHTTPEPPRSQFMDSVEHRTQPGEPSHGPIEPGPTFSDEELSFSMKPGDEHRTAAADEAHGAIEHEPAQPGLEEGVDAEEVDAEEVDAEEVDAEEVDAEEQLQHEPDVLEDDYVPGDEVTPRPDEDEEQRPFRPRSRRDDRRDDRRGGRRDGRRDDRRGRGRRPMGRPGAGRPKPLIQDIFRKGQEVLVQVIKEGIGTKGPTLSTYISIAGRYLVLMPGLNRIGVSRKIVDEDQRRRLREILSELQPPRGLGFIIRTAGLDRNKRELQRDLLYLAKVWQVVVRRIKKSKSPAVIYEESDMITRTIRDTFTSEIDTVWVDEKAAFDRAQEFMQVVMPRYAERIKLYDGPEPMFHKFGIENEIIRIQQRHVPLPNGGSIVIDQTEALVAIDVNSGNFRADNNAEETAYQMNLLAAKEIARQLRLRDLGGVIINDFIDMREERHRRGVERGMREAVRRDRARTKILRISQFGIIEMTRQRIRPSLKRSVYQDCPHCLGTGQVKTCESMSIDVMRLLQLAAHRHSVHRVQVRVHEDVAHYLLNRKRGDIARLEQGGEIAVSIHVAHDVSPEFMEFVCYDNNNNEVKFLPHEEPRPMRRRG